MRPSIVVSAVLVCLLGPTQAFGAATRVGALRVDLPAGFTPVPTSVARASAQPLVALLKAAGLPAVGVLRVRQDIFGAPQAPLASFIGARIRVLSRPEQPLPDLTACDLAGALHRAGGDDPALTWLEPRPCTTNLGPGTELGWTLTSADGRARLVHYLLVARRAEIAVFALQVEDVDVKRWESAWTGIQRSAVLEAPSMESGLPLWPVLPLALAAAALLAALLHRPARSSTSLSPEIVALMGLRTDQERAPRRAPQRAESALQAPLPVREPSAAPPRALSVGTPPARAVPAVASEGEELLKLVGEPSAAESGEGKSLLELKLARRIG